MTVADYLNAQSTFDITMTAAIRPVEDPVEDHIVSHGANLRKVGLCSKIEQSNLILAPYRCIGAFRRWFLTMPSPAAI